MSESPVICFYHKDCVDGTTAAAVVLQKYNNAQAFPLGFESAEEDIKKAKTFITNDTLIIYVDNVIGLEEIAALGNEIIVIDHHASEYSKVLSLVIEYVNITYIFDKEESGASLAFKYFFAGEPLPKIISYVRDIDLWKKELVPESEQAHLYLSLSRNEPHKLQKFLTNASEEYLESGEVLAEYVNDEVSRVVTIEPNTIQVNTWQIPAYNITNHQSKAGNVLSELTGTAVLLYTILGNRVRCSVRSKEGQSPTALEVSAALGGGGHEHAAGVVVRGEHFFSLLKE